MAERSDGMQKKELLFAALCAAAAAAIFAAVNIGKSTGEVQISVDGKLFGRYSLDAENRIDINGKNTLVIENGSAYMEYADCPDKICIGQGRISDSSESIVCLPNKVVVTIDAKSGIDAKTR